MDAYPSLTTHENSIGMLDVQVLDLTKGIKFLAWISACVLVGAWLAYSGRVALSAVLFFVAFNSVTAFLFLVGGKRVIASSLDDILLVTFRAPLRRTQTEVRISDIHDIVPVKISRAVSSVLDFSTTGIPEKGEVFAVEARFRDREPILLFRRNGALGLELAKIVANWWERSEGRQR